MILQIKNNKVIDIFDTYYQAGKDTGINKGSISKACRNYDRSAAGGYQWKEIKYWGVFGDGTIANFDKIHEVLTAKPPID